MSEIGVSVAVAILFIPDDGWYYQIHIEDFPPPDGPYHQCGPHSTRKSNIECCEHNAPIFAKKFLKWKKRVTN